MKKISAFLLIVLLTKNLYSQIWSNNNNCFYVSKIDTTILITIAGTNNYCSIIQSKLFSWRYEGINLYEDVNFVNRQEIFTNIFPRFLYTASNDTMYGLRVKTFQYVKRYFYFESDTLKEAYVNIANDYNKMWMGNYYINVNFKDSNNLKIINRQEQVIKKALLLKMTIGIINGSICF